MIKIVVLFFMSILMDVTAGAQDKEVAVLRKMNEDWLQSYVTKDTASLSRIFADDFVLTNHRGIRMSKHQIISNLSLQETKSIDIDSLDIKILTPDVGLVTVYSSFNMTSNGKELKGRNCYQDVYIKRDNRWYAVAAHVTLLSLQ